MVTEAKSLERRYHFEGSEAVRTAHEAGRAPPQRRPPAGLRLDPSPATRATVERLLFLQARYARRRSGLFAAVDAGDDAGVQHFEHEVIDPTYGVLEDGVPQQARGASAAALAYSARCAATRRAPAASSRSRSPSASACSPASRCSCASAASRRRPRSPASPRSR